MSTEQKRKRRPMNQDQLTTLYSMLDMGHSFPDAAKVARSRETRDHYAAKRAEEERHRRLVADWNAANPVGAEVAVQHVRGGPTFPSKTRSEAFVNCAGRASVFIEGQAGWWGLEWVRPCVADVGTP